MGFLKKIGQTVEGAASFVGEKNRRAAAVNRVRTVIRCEEKAAEKEYLALGRYYYNNLRDKNNPVTEAHCAQLEVIEARLDRAIGQLEKLYGDEDAAGAMESYEEVTLEDVKELKADPALTEEVSQEGDIPPQELAAETENDGLPFEG